MKKYTGEWQNGLKHGKGTNAPTVPEPAIVARVYRKRGMGELVAAVEALIVEPNEHTLYLSQMQKIVFKYQ